jgi:fimbrial chaperone protein
VQASGLRITPVRLDFSPRQPTGQIELSNQNAAPKAVQVKAFRWSQKDGVDTYEPSADLFFAPPIVTVPGNGRTLVRFRQRVAAPVDREYTYRVFFEELPGAVQDEDMAGMKFRTRFGIPMFVRPAKPVWPAISAATTRDADGLRVKLKNSGAAHVRILELRLYPDSVDTRNPDQAVVAQATQPEHGEVYLLPGSESTWLLSLAAGANPSGLKLLVLTDDYSGHGAPGITQQGAWWTPAAGAGAASPAKP